MDHVALQSETVNWTLPK